MNKTELIRAVSEKADISQAKVGLVVDAITDAVTQALAAGGGCLPGRIRHL